VPLQVVWGYWTSILVSADDHTITQGHYTQDSKPKLAGFTCCVSRRVVIYEGRAVNPRYDTTSHLACKEIEALEAHQRAGVVHVDLVVCARMFEPLLSDIGFTSIKYTYLTRVILYT
jgi:hypothetical protein